MTASFSDLGEGEKEFSLPRLVFYPSKTSESKVAAIRLRMGRGAIFLLAEGEYDKVLFIRCFIYSSSTVPFMGKSSLTKGCL